MSDRTNRAVDRLADALYELCYRGRIGIKPDIRLLLCPGEPKAEDAPHLYAVGMSAEVADRLAEAIEQLLITLDTEAPGQPVDPSGAAVFAETNPDLAAELTGVFNELDLAEITRTVLDDTDPCDRMTVTRALDGMFGDCATEDEEENGDER
jgi:hypothetical protein